MSTRDDHSAARGRAIPAIQDEHGSPEHSASGGRVSRRSVINMLVRVAAATALPLPLDSNAATTVTVDSTIEEVAAKLTEACEQHENANKAYSAAEELIFKWQERNPKPAMRDTVVGTNAEYGLWTKGLGPNPNADLKAAIAEHNAALTAWDARKKVAEAQCGFFEADAADAAAAAEVMQLVDELANIQAQSLTAMKIKATLAARLSDADLAWSLVDDLNGLPGVEA